MKNILSEEFVIAYRCLGDNQTSFPLAPNDNLSSFCIIKNPLLFWAADPFVVEYNNSVYIFAELFNKFTGVGKIYCLDLKSKKRKWIRCNIAKCHLSFPNVFVINDELYMIPETSEKQEISVYKCVRFPDLWEKNQTLVSTFKYVDTIFGYNQTFLLSYCISLNPRELHFIDKNGYISKKLTDFDKTLRPAGKIFESNSHNIFPSQISINHYGEGICFNLFDGEIIKPLCEFKPNGVMLNHFRKKIIGCHTYNRAGQFEVIDLKYIRFSLLRIVGYPFRKLFKTRKR